MERWNPSDEGFDIATDDDLSSDEEGGGASSQDESENDETDDRTQTNSVSQKPFSKAERNRLRKCLVQFGFGRWKRIKESGKLPRRSIEEVVAFAEALLKKCLTHLRDPEDWNQFIQQIENFDKSEEGEGSYSSAERSLSKNTIEILDDSSPTTNLMKNEISLSGKEEIEEQKQKSSTLSVIPNLNFENDPTLNELKFVQYLERNAKILCKSMKTVARLGRLVRNHKDIILALDTSEIPLTSWWNSKCDIKIILGW